MNTYDLVRFNEQRQNDIKKLKQEARRANITAQANKLQEDVIKQDMQDAQAQNMTTAGLIPNSNQVNPTPTNIDNNISMPTDNNQTLLGAGLPDTNATVPNMDINATVPTDINATIPQVSDIQQTPKPQSTVPETHAADFSKDTSPYSLQTRLMASKNKNLSDNTERHIIGELSRGTSSIDLSNPINIPDGKAYKINNSLRAGQDTYVVDRGGDNVTIATKSGLELESRLKPQGYMDKAITEAYEKGTVRVIGDFNKRINIDDAEKTYGKAMADSISKIASKVKSEYAFINNALEGGGLNPFSVDENKSIQEQYKKWEENFLKENSGEEYAIEVASRNNLGYATSFAMRLSNGESVILDDLLEDIMIAIGADSLAIAAEIAAVAMATPAPPQGKAIAGLAAGTAKLGTRAAYYANMLLRTSVAAAGANAIVGTTVDNAVLNQEGFNVTAGDMAKQAAGRAIFAGTANAVGDLALRGAGKAIGGTYRGVSNGLQMVTGVGKYSVNTTLKYFKEIYKRTNGSEYDDLILDELIAAREARGYKFSHEEQQAKRLEALIYDQIETNGQMRKLIADAIAYLGNNDMIANITNATNDSLMMMAKELGINNIVSYINKEAAVRGKDSVLRLLQSRLSLSSFVNSSDSIKNKAINEITNTYNRRFSVPVKTNSSRQTAELKTNHPGFFGYTEVNSGNNNKYFRANSIERELLNSSKPVLEDVYKALKSNAEINLSDLIEAHSNITKLLDGARIESSQRSALEDLLTIVDNEIEAVIPENKFGHVRNGIWSLNDEMKTATREINDMRRNTMQAELKDEIDSVLNELAIGVTNNDARAFNRINRMLASASKDIREPMETYILRVLTGLEDPLINPETSRIAKNYTRLSNSTFLEDLKKPSANVNKSTMPSLVLNVDNIASFLNKIDFRSDSALIVKNWLLNDHIFRNMQIVGKYIMDIADEFVKAKRGGQALTINLWEKTKYLIASVIFNYIKALFPFIQAGKEARAIMAMRYIFKKGNGFDAGKASRELANKLDIPQEVAYQSVANFLKLLNERTLFEYKSSDEHLKVIGDLVNTNAIPKDQNDLYRLLSTDKDLLGQVTTDLLDQEIADIAFIIANNNNRMYDILEYLQGKLNNLTFEKRQQLYIGMSKILGETDIINRMVKGTNLTKAQADRLYSDAYAAICKYLVDTNNILGSLGQNDAIFKGIGFGVAKILAFAYMKDINDAIAQVLVRMAEIKDPKLTRAMFSRIKLYLGDTHAQGIVQAAHNVAGSSFRALRNEAEQALKREANNVLEAGTKPADNVLEAGTKQADEAKQADNVLEAGTKQADEAKQATKPADNILEAGTKQATKPADNVLEAGTKQATKPADNVLEAGTKQADEAKQADNVLEAGTKQADEAKQATKPADNVLEAGTKQADEAKQADNVLEAGTKQADEAKQATKPAMDEGQINARRKKLGITKAGLPNFSRKATTVRTQAGIATRIEQIENMYRNFGIEIPKDIHGITAANKKLIELFGIDDKVLSYNTQYRELKGIKPNVHRDTQPTPKEKPEVDSRDTKALENILRNFNINVPRTLQEANDTIKSIKNLYEDDEAGAKEIIDIVNEYTKKANLSDTGTSRADALRNANNNRKVVKSKKIGDATPDDFKPVTKHSHKASAKERMEDWSRRDFNSVATKLYLQENPQILKEGETIEQATKRLMARASMLYNTIKQIITNGNTQSATYLTDGNYKIVTPTKRSRPFISSEEVDEIANRIADTSLDYTKSFPYKEDLKQFTYNGKTFKLVDKGSNNYKYFKEVFNPETDIPPKNIANEIQIDGITYVRRGDNFISKAYADVYDSIMAYRAKIEQNIESLEYLKRYDTVIANYSKELSEVELQLENALADFNYVRQFSHYYDAEDTAFNLSKIDLTNIHGNFEKQKKLRTDFNAFVNENIDKFSKELYQAETKAKAIEKELEEVTKTLDDYNDKIIKNSIKLSKDGNIRLAELSTKKEVLTYEYQQLAVEIRSLRQGIDDLKSGDPAIRENFDNMINQAIELANLVDNLQARKAELTNLLEAARTKRGNQLKKQSGAKSNLKSYYEYYELTPTGYRITGVFDASEVELRAYTRLYKDAMVKVAAGDETAKDTLIELNNIIEGLKRELDDRRYRLTPEGNHKYRLDTIDGSAKYYQDGLVNMRVYSSYHDDYVTEKFGVVGAKGKETLEPAKVKYSKDKIDEVFGYDRKKAAKTLVANVKNTMFAQYYMYKVDAKELENIARKLWVSNYSQFHDPANIIQVERKHGNGGKKTKVVESLNNDTLDELAALVKQELQPLDDITTDGFILDTIKKVISRIEPESGTEAERKLLQMLLLEELPSSFIGKRSNNAMPANLFSTTRTKLYNITGNPSATNKGHRPRGVTHIVHPDNKGLYKRFATPQGATESLRNYKATKNFTNKGATELREAYKKLGLDPDLGNDLQSFNTRVWEQFADKPTKTTPSIYKSEYADEIIKNRLELEVLKRQTKELLRGSPIDATVKYPVKSKVIGNKEQAIEHSINANGFTSMLKTKKGQQQVRVFMSNALKGNGNAALYNKASKSKKLGATMLVASIGEGTSAINKLFPNTASKIAGDIARSFFIADTGQKSLSLLNASVVGAGNPLTGVTDKAIKGKFSYTKASAKKTFEDTLTRNLQTAWGTQYYKKLKGINNDIYSLIRDKTLLEGLNLANKDAMEHILKYLSGDDRKNVFNKIVAELKYTYNGRNEVSDIVDKVIDTIYFEGEKARDIVEDIIEGREKDLYVAYQMLDYILSIPAERDFKNATTADLITDPKFYKAYSDAVDTTLNETSYMPLIDFDNEEVWYIRQIAPGANDLDGVVKKLSKLVSRSGTTMVKDLFGEHTRMYAIINTMYPNLKIKMSSLDYYGEFHADSDTIILNSGMLTTDEGKDRLPGTLMHEINHALNSVDSSLGYMGSSAKGRALNDLEYTFNINEVLSRLAETNLQKFRTNNSRLGIKVENVIRAGINNTMDMNKVQGAANDARVNIHSRDKTLYSIFFDLYEPDENTARLSRLTKNTKHYDGDYYDASDHLIDNYAQKKGQNNFIMNGL